MAAPTWPPTPEDARKATLEEYGDDARAVLAFETDEEAEEALLARFLFAPPKRQLADGEEAGTSLDTLLRSLHAWLRMVSGMDFPLSYSDPPSTDGSGVFLPRAVPAPAQPAEDALLYRAMGLVQLGFLRYKLLSNRQLLTEIHTDWVLRSCYHLLAARYIVRRWSEEWPGIKQDFDGVRYLDKAGIMRVNVTTVPRRGMPGAFLPLYRGLTEFLEPPGPEGALAEQATAAVDGIQHDSAAPLVVAGQAQRLRQELRRLRLGPPPLPYFVGILRPEWLLHDLVAEAAAANEWKKGSKPLRLLIDTMKRKGAAESRLGGIWRRVRASEGPPPPEDIITTEIEARPDEEGREHDEWDAERGCYKIAATRVLEAEATSGPLESYQRILDANGPQIREVRRRFEALRLEERWLHGQPDGPEIDLNRAVAAMADVRAGFSPKVDWYKRFQRQKQSIAILTLVDLSGSTQGNIIRLQQEALVLFAEGLRTLRFPHAFYGFSNRGPRDCRMQRIKGFEEPYDPAVYKRLGNLRPGGASRLGAFLRHAGWMMSSLPQSRRILLLISDGKPEDRGEYRGEYGVKDSALAVGEARRQGVHLHCVSLDTSEGAEGYLKRIFGPTGYLLLDRVDDLPARLPEAFRALIR